MIEKSIGLIRNLIKKRKQLIATVKQLAVADDAIIIIHKENQFTVLGHVEDDAMAVYMIGTATGLGFANAKSRDPNLTVEEYLHQPTSVAFKQIEKQGLL